jgi:hypothetical protein
MATAAAGDYGTLVYSRQCRYDSGHRDLRSVAKESSKLASTALFKPRRSYAIRVGYSLKEA